MFGSLSSLLFGQNGMVFQIVITVSSDIITAIILNHKSHK